MTIRPSQVNVVTPPTNSPTTETNSYQVQFVGPDRMFDDELFVAQPISGTLQRICNSDGTWIERIFFSTNPSQIISSGGSGITPPSGPTEIEITLVGDVIGSGTFNG